MPHLIALAPYFLRSFLYLYNKYKKCHLLTIRDKVAQKKEK